MAKLLKLRRGTTSDHNSFTGAEGEVTVDTTKDTLVVHDGSTQGGHPLAKSSDVSGFATTTGATFTGNIVFDNDNQVQFQEGTANGNAYVGLKGPTDMGSASSYTLTLPAASPTTGQVLKSSSTATTLEWASDSSTTNLGQTASGTGLTITSSSGTNVDLPAVTTSAWGVMTDEDKTKLDGIATGAEVNVQSDWNSSSGDNQILNKPTIIALSGANAWTGSQRGKVHTISATSTLNIPLDSGQHFIITANGDGTLTFTDLDSDAVGQSGVIYFTNGAHTHAYASHVKKAAAVTIGSTAGDYIIPYTVIATDKVCIDVIAVG